MFPEGLHSLCEPENKLNAFHARRLPRDSLQWYVCIERRLMTPEVICATQQYETL